MFRLSFLAPFPPSEIEFRLVHPSSERAVFEPSRPPSLSHRAGPRPTLVSSHRVHLLSGFSRPVSLYL
ncbi:unnamed protein product [Citrullus colocynthis]|uniref:Uncharacterized protein n=1 Tax=Citrullus colocynthis TaxID=252529 RepID=A0ABP0YV16_9ROSI